MKLKLLPHLQVSSDFQQVTLTGSSESLMFPADFTATLEKLAVGCAPEELTEIHAPYLLQLAEARLIIDADTITPELSYWLTRRYYPKFVKAQLALGVEIVGNQEFADTFFAAYPSVARGTRITVAVDCESKGLPVRFTEHFATMGPLLHKPPVGELAALPDGLKKLAYGLIATELYQLVVTAGNHGAICSQVSWNLKTLERLVT